MLRICNLLKPIIGQLLEAYREKHNLSLEDVARDSGVDKTALHRIEQGNICSSKYVPVLIAWMFSTKTYGNK